MISTFKPRFDILPPAQIELWEMLGPVKDLGLVLNGETVLSIDGVIASA